MAKLPEREQELVTSVLEELVLQVEQRSLLSRSGDCRGVPGTKVGANDCGAPGGADIVSADEPGRKD